MLRKLLLFLTAAVLSVGVLLWTCRSIIGAMLIERLTDNAKSSGLSLRVGKQSLNYRSFSLEDVQLDGIWGGTPVSLKVDELTISPTWASLLSGKGEAAFQGRLYRGTLEGRAYLLLSDGSGSASAVLDRLELSDYPLLGALGIDRGQLSLRVPSLSWKKGAPTGTFELEVIKARKAVASTLPKGMAIPITIPAFERVDISAKGGLAPSGIVLRPLTVNCDFGELTGDLSASQRADSRALVLDGELETSLSESGGSLIGDWLPVISQGSLQKDVRKFTVHFSGPSSRPQIRMTPR